MANIKNITEVDFALLKQSLKTFLSEQDEFADYDFEGAGINILLDVLAYNTQFSAYYANMAANEQFIDSALMRPSLVSHAKALNYTPRSMTASRAIINLRFNSPSGSPSSIGIPKGTKFTTTIDNKAYTFYTNDAYTAYATENYEVNDIIIYEGQKYEYRYTVNTSQVQHFIIPSKNIDASLISVKVQTSSVDLNQTVYSLNDDATTIDSNSTVYFIQETIDGMYEIVFGDGTLGKSLSNGNIVILEYAITSGDVPNNATSFSLSGTINGFTNVTITLNQKSFGGSDKESIESIRFTAPKNYQAQGRAVTVSDYQALIPTLFGNAKSTKVWGGEDNVPPIYGKVFISLQPNDGYVVTETIKDYIVNTLLKPYSLVSIIPEVIDPEYTYLIVTTTVKYNPTVTSLAENEIKSNVLDAILEYGENSINKFDKPFRYSSLVKLIDAVSPAITSNLSEIKIKNFLAPTISTKLSYTVSFNNAIDSGTISSTGFSHLEDGNGGAYTSYIDDDGAGNLRTYRLVGSTKVYIDELAGTVDYTTGKLILDAITVASTVNSDSTISIITTPQNFDVIPERNQILLLESQNISISMQTDI